MRIATGQCHFSYLQPFSVLGNTVATLQTEVAALLAADGRYGDIAVRQDLTGRDRFVTATRSNRS